MAREGLPITIFSLTLAIAFAISAYLLGYDILKVLLVVSAGFSLFCALFYRDPDREVPLDPTKIVSPADGRIVGIHPVSDDYVGKDALRISIFLNLLNVHVNRVPCSGSVVNSRYKPGRFLPAFDPRTPEDNEQTIIDIQNNRFKLRLIQIAGVISRRIVNNLRPGDSAVIGSRFGLIKFGSRVDVIVPAEMELRIRLKQKVKAGKTILGGWRV